MRAVAAALFAIIAVAAPPAAGHAETPGEARTRVGDLMVEHAWARRGGATTGAAYLVIVNLGAASDRLRAVACPAARKATLHETVVEGGIAEMRPVDGIEVPPGEHVFLQPGGRHIMLMGLAEPLEEGRTVPLRLEFERAGAVELAVPVRGMGYRGPHDADGRHGGEHERHHGGDGQHPGRPPGADRN